MYLEGGIRYNILMQNNDLSYWKTQSSLPICKFFFIQQLAIVRETNFVTSIEKMNMQKQQHLVSEELRFDLDGCNLLLLPPFQSCLFTSQEQNPHLVEGNDSLQKSISLSLLTDQQPSAHLKTLLSLFICDKSMTSILIKVGMRKFYRASEIEIKVRACI